MPRNTYNFIVLMKDAKIKLLDKYLSRKYILIPLIVAGLDIPKEW